MASLLIGEFVFQYPQRFSQLPNRILTHFLAALPMANGWCSETEQAKCLEPTRPWCRSRGRWGTRLAIRAPPPLEKFMQSYGLRTLLASASAISESASSCSRKPRAIALAAAALTAATYPAWLP